MKTITSLDQLPNEAAYIGSEYPDGTIDEATADAIAEAPAPICYRDEDGQRHFFTETN